MRFCKTEIHFLNFEINLTYSPWSSFIQARSIIFERKGGCSLIKMSCQPRTFHCWIHYFHCHLLCSHKETTGESKGGYFNPPRCATCLSSSSCPKRWHSSWVVILRLDETTFAYNQQWSDLCNLFSKWVLISLMLMVKHILYSITCSSLSMFAKKEISKFFIEMFYLKLPLPYYNKRITRVAKIKKKNKKIQHITMCW